MNDAPGVASAQPAARARAATAWLRARGFPQARVEPAGHQSDIAVVEGVAEELASLAPDLRAFGFHYVTIELHGDG